MQLHRQGTAHAHLGEPNSRMGDEITTSGDLSELAQAQYDTALEDMADVP
jgi:hypothetical protein